MEHVHRIQCCLVQLVVHRGVQPSQKEYGTMEVLNQLKLYKQLSSNYFITSLARLLMPVCLLPERRRDSEGDATQRIAQRDFADFSWRWNKRSASSLDGALRKGKRVGLEICVASNPYSGSEEATHSASVESL